MRPVAPSVEQHKLSLAEFHQEFCEEKPYFEFWDGEAVQKSKPTRMHSLVQKILVRRLDTLGCDAGHDVTLKLDASHEPIPDVIAAEGSIGDPYPTKPFEVVIEVLSPDDSFSRMLRKCSLYKTWRIQQIVVIDPLARAVWSFEKGSLHETDIVARRGSQTIGVEELWAEVDRVLTTAPPAGAAD